VARRTTGRLHSFCHLGRGLLIQVIDVPSRYSARFMSEEASRVILRGDSIRDVVGNDVDACSSFAAAARDGSLQRATNNFDVLGGSRSSDGAWQASFNVAVGASPFASHACVSTWLTDFRADLGKLDAPVLVMHGTEDRILRFEATAARLPALIADCTLVPIAGGLAQHRVDPLRGSKSRLFDRSSRWPQAACERRWA
jgi:pimeloyl-ACP methyl ester carboxylesterase